MTSTRRQHALFVTEDWTRIYEALDNIKFSGYDFQTLLNSIVDYIKITHPEDYNDFISSSEFITKVEIMAWLFQNIAFRLDLNVRENVLSTAERKDSLINLAHMLGYKNSRLRAATGRLRVTTVTTTENIIDSNGVDLSRKKITWNDSRDADWYERFIRIMNAAMVTRTPFRQPLRTYNDDNTKLKQYLLRSTIPLSGTYSFSAKTGRTATKLQIHNTELDSTYGSINEVAPNFANSLPIYYSEDGQGFSSRNTGFFFPVTEGSLEVRKITLGDVVESFFSYDLNVENVAENSVFIQNVDSNGNVIGDWTEVSSIYGEGVSFAILDSSKDKVFELLSKDNDQVSVQFGDGNYGAVPSGTLSLWHRVGNSDPTPITRKRFGAQSFSIPYYKDKVLHTLTMTVQLVDDVNNGAKSESTEDIRTRAGKLFYTQNRMVNGQDYNNMFLTDTRIAKVKATNHSFNGQSRYSKLVDPSGLYENINQIATDGRIFINIFSKLTEIEDKQIITEPATIVNDTMSKMIGHPSVIQLHHTLYRDIILNSELTWKETKNEGGVSYGNIVNSTGNAVKLGTTTVGELSRFGQESYVKIKNLRGKILPVMSMTDDGSASGAVAIQGISNGDKIYSYKPDFRKTFTDNEKREVTEQLKLKSNFGLSWNDDTYSWKIVSDADMSTSNDTFDIDNIKDISGTKKNDAWIIKVNYVSDTQSSKWRIYQKGATIGFESENEIDFFYTNLDKKVVDPVTGNLKQDAIVVLPCNETKYSLNRRGLNKLGPVNAYHEPFTFVGDGTTTCFKTDWSPLDPRLTVVIKNDELQIYESEYSITRRDDGDEICFTTAPAKDDQIIVYYDSQFVRGQFGVKSYTASGTNSIFAMGDSCIDLNNTIVFVDSVLQTPLDQYSVIVGDNDNTSVFFKTPPPKDTIVTIHYISGVNGNVFNRTSYYNDVDRTSMPVSVLPESFDTTLVSIDGVVQSSKDYSFVNDISGSSLSMSPAFPAGTTTSALTIDGNNVCDRPLIRTAASVYTTDGTTTTYVVKSGTTMRTDGTGVMVFLDGIYQMGPSELTPTWSVSNDSIIFNAAPPASLSLHIVSLQEVIGLRESKNPVTNLKRVVYNTTAHLIGDGLNKVIDLGSSSITGQNVLVWLDSVSQQQNVNWTIAPMGNGNSAIIFTDPIPTNVTATVYFFANTDYKVFQKASYVTDGTTTAYVAGNNQTNKSVLVSLNGILQAPSTYDVSQKSGYSVVTFFNAPTANLSLVINYIEKPDEVKSFNYDYNGDGTKTEYELTGADALQYNGRGIIVMRDGVMQLGPLSPNPAWHVSGKNIVFNDIPNNGAKIHIFYVQSVPDNKVNGGRDVNQISDDTADPRHESYAKFIGGDVQLWPIDNLYHNDAYVNKNGLVVVPSDYDNNGKVDYPLFFQDFVIMDDHSDLVLWIQKERDGIKVWEPLGENTTPRGFYGASTNGSTRKENDTVDNSLYRSGDIFYNADDKVWLEADSTTGLWKKSGDQTIYKSVIGRSKVQFRWQHYAPDSHRIDPAKSNIIHVFILTDLYNTVYKQWVDRNNASETEPVTETPDQLREKFKNFEKFKMISDNIIFHPVRFKPLFGSRAKSEVQAYFDVVQNRGSQLSESDLKVRILNVIDEYFNITRWDVGEGGFYFSELAAFVHTAMAPHVQSFTISSKDASRPFGDLFKIRAEPDEMFISVAGVEDIRISTQ